MHSPQRLDQYFLNIHHPSALWFVYLTFSPPFRIQLSYDPYKCKLRAFTFDIYHPPLIFIYSFIFFYFYLFFCFFSFCEDTFSFFFVIGFIEMYLVSWNLAFTRWKSIPKKNHTCIFTVAITSYVFRRNGWREFNWLIISWHYLTGWALIMNITGKVKQFW